MRLLDNKRFIVALAMGAALLLSDLVFASADGEGGHGGPVLDILLQLIVILLAAKLGGDVFERFKQPAVLGELIMGMLIGNLHLVGYSGFDGFVHNQILQVLAELGVIILLFEVGLESTVREMMRVGLVSFMVAIFGVIAPFFLGWGVGVVFLPEESVLVHVFIGATLTATSVGITARVLKDIGRIQSREARIILGAAVIDDILGLVILAVVTGIITASNAGGEGLSSGDVLLIIGKAVVFIVGAITIGAWLLPTYFKVGLKLKGHGVFLSFCLLVCFGLAYVAGLVGLAPIVGAFAAGLILEEVQYRDFYTRGEVQVEKLIAPIATFLVPIFFVRMGMSVDLVTFTRVDILGFAAVMTVAAIVGKQACSLAIFDRSLNRISIGLGMIPRGEVGLIFASIGASLVLNGNPVISTATYSAVVIMVIITTVVTPPALKISLLRGESKIKSIEPSDK